jgi:phospholipid/cholesterol/gamma-HCH transport system substrate-binding protein
MVSRAQKIRLGVFITIGSLLILLFVGVIAGSKLVQHREEYYIQFSDVSVNGLQEGGNVNYHGIKIGRVQNIRISKRDVSKIIITISVEAGTPIKTYVVATLVPVGITGLKYVELRGGTNAAPRLKPKSFIPTGRSSFEDITTKAASIAEKLDLLIGNLAEITGEKNQKMFNETIVNLDSMVVENRSDLRKIVANMNTVSAAAADLSVTGARRLDHIASSVDSTMARINKLANSPALDSLLLNTSRFSGELAASNVKQLMEDLNVTVRQANITLSSVDRTLVRGRGDILETIDNLRELTENLDEFAKQINENPSILLRGRRN